MGEFIEEICYVIWITYKKKINRTNIIDLDSSTNTGIMGFSAEDYVLPKEMYEHDIIEHNMFSMCFRREVLTDSSNQPTSRTKIF